MSRQARKLVDDAIAWSSATQTGVDREDRKLAYYMDLIRKQEEQETGNRKSVKRDSRASSTTSIPVPKAQTSAASTPSPNPRPIAKPPKRLLELKETDQLDSPVKRKPGRPPKIRQSPLESGDETKQPQPPVDSPEPTLVITEPRFSRVEKNKQEAAPVVAPEPPEIKQKPGRKPKPPKPPKPSKPENKSSPTKQSQPRQEEPVIRSDGANIPDFTFLDKGKDIWWRKGIRLEVLPEVEFKFKEPADKPPLAMQKILPVDSSKLSNDISSIIKRF